MYDSVAHPTKQFECDYRIHARRGMHRDGLVSNATYVCLVRSIKKQDATAKICIFSEGSVEQFGELVKEDVTLVLNGDPAETFHGLVTAPNLFLGHSPLSHAAAMLATQAKVYTVPWEPGMSRAVANCWSPGDCSACYAKRKDNVPCCAPRNARVVDTLRNLNTWSLMGVTDQSYDRDPTGKGTWAPLPPQYEGEADWVKAWRKEESLYATKWVPPKPSTRTKGPTSTSPSGYGESAASRRRRRRRSRPGTRNRAFGRRCIGRRTSLAGSDAAVIPPACSPRRRRTPCRRSRLRILIVDFENSDDDPLNRHRFPEPARRSVTSGSMSRWKPQRASGKISSSSLPKSWNAARLNFCGDLSPGTEPPCTPSAAIPAPATHLRMGFRQGCDTTPSHH